MPLFTRVVYLKAIAKSLSIYPLRIRVLLGISEVNNFFGRKEKVKRNFIKLPFTG